MRTIRWYTSIGLLDRPAAMRGRTALYGRSHLAQLVAIKRLQADGLTVAAVQERLLGADETAIEEIALLPTDLSDLIAQIEASDAPPAPATATAAATRKRFWVTPATPPRTRITRAAHSTPSSRSTPSTLSTRSADSTRDAPSTLSAHSPHSPRTTGADHPHRTRPAQRIHPNHRPPQDHHHGRPRTDHPRHPPDPRRHPAPAARPRAGRRSPRRDRRGGAAAAGPAQPARPVRQLTH